MASGEVSPGRRAHSLTISASLASSVLRKSATVSTPAPRIVLPRDLPTVGIFSTGRVVAGSAFCGGPFVAAAGGRALADAVRIGLPSAARLLLTNPRPWPV